MISSRSFGLSLFACVAAAALTFACSSNSSPNPSGAPDDGGNPSTGDDDDDDRDGGPSTGDDDDDGTPDAGGSGAFRQCAGGGSTTCTKAELDSYGSCIMNACKVTYAECYGPNFDKGQFAGACGPTIACFNACECGDVACYSKCPAPSDACTACMEKVADCSSTCQAPACLEENPGGGGKTCADLSACCATKTGDDKETCTMALGAANGNDAACGGLYTALGCP